MDSTSKEHFEHLERRFEYWEKRCETENQRIVIRAIVDIDDKNGGQSIIIQELHNLGLKTGELADALCGLERLGLIRDCTIFSGCPCIFTLNR